jgi:hypothetical protein
MAEDPTLVRALVRRLRDVQEQRGYGIALPSLPVLIERLAGQVEPGDLSWHPLIDPDYPHEVGNHPRRDRSPCVGGSASALLGRALARCGRSQRGPGRPV